MSGGWVKLHRSCLEHWVATEPDKFGAWCQMLLMANHRDNKFLFDGELVSCPRGSFVTSKRSLGARWKWSREKTETFFKTLEADGMIHTKPGHRHTHVFIINYDSYQSSDTEDRATDQAKTGPLTGPVPGHRPTPNKNDKNDKKEKKIDPELSQFGKILRMTKPEWAKVTADFGTALINQELSEADIWLEKAQTPNAHKYRKDGWNHYLFFRGWLSDKKLKNQPSLFGAQDPHQSRARLPEFVPPAPRKEEAPEVKARVKSLVSEALTKMQQRQGAQAPPGPTLPMDKGAK